MDCHFSKISVANRKRGETFDVYIGRGTPFGNPNSLADGKSRQEALEGYQSWFAYKLQNQPEFVDQLRGLEGKVLGCSCHPQPCHGHFIAAWVENDVRKRLRSTLELPNMDGMTLEEKAYTLAHWAHGQRDQKRKFTDAPYIEHPDAVVRHLRQLGAPEPVLAAAWLHDTLEDTLLQPDDIREHCGDAVLLCVQGVTSYFHQGHGSRADRHAFQVAKVAQQGPWTQTLKLCDRLHNLQGLQHQPGQESFFQLYWKEGKDYCQALQQAHAEVKHSIIEMVSPSRGGMSP